MRGAVKRAIHLVAFVLVTSPGLRAAAQGALGEGVITKVAVKSYEEAKKKAVTSVKDGDSVYLNLKLPNAVETYLNRWEYSDRYANADKKVLFIDIGPKGQTNESWEHGYILPKPEEMKQNFVSVNLAPGAASPMWVGLWMKIVGGGSPGKWENEFRIYALGGTEDTVQSARRLLAVVPLTADVESGISKYAAQAEEYKKRYEAGDASFNELPPKGTLVDKAAAKGVLAAAKNDMNEKVAGFYFTDSGWYEHKDQLGRLEKYTTPAALFYQRQGKKWVRYIEVTKWRSDGKIDIALNSELELSADKYTKALSLAK